MVKKISDFNRQGFTLIELLVVISIIGLLSNVVLSSLNSARESARDTIRQSDVRTIQTALEMYYSNYGQYPAQTSWINSNAANWQTSNLATALDPYLSQLPEDPLNDSVHYYRFLNHSAYSGVNYQGYWLMVMEYEDSALNTELEASDGILECTGNTRDYSSSIEYGGNCVQ